MGPVFFDSFGWCFGPNLLFILLGKLGRNRFLFYRRYNYRGLLWYNLDTASGNFQYQIILAFFPDNLALKMRWMFIPTSVYGLNRLFRKSDRHALIILSDNDASLRTLLIQKQNFIYKTWKRKQQSLKNAKHPIKYSYTIAISWLGF